MNHNYPLRFLLQHLKIGTGNKISLVLHSCMAMQMMISILPPIKIRPKLLKVSLPIYTASYSIETNFFATAKLASVLDLTSSTVTPGAISVSVKPPFSRSTSNTHYGNRH
jgi:hypothetical protein